MKGKVKTRNGRSYVQWGNYKVYRYKGEVCKGALGELMARKLLATMQSEYENYPESFRIEKYTQQRSDVIPYLREWLQSVKSTLSPATYHDYKNSIENHLVPIFKTKNLQLHEIRYDDLCNILNLINRDGKGKQNTMYCLHTCMIHAWKSGRILAMPPFPEKRKYGIINKKIISIPEARQIAIIQAIPIEHQPIFWWLKYHYRRPSEAIVLHKEDYDKERDCFIIRRGMSRKVERDRTKTNAIHDVPCHPEFRQWLLNKPTTFGDYFFCHKNSRQFGQRYSQCFLNTLWNEACKKVGEKITLYQGTKHSSCTAFVNEYGGSLSELQMLTDHKRPDSVKRYADVQLQAKRRLMGKVIPIQKQKSENE